MRRLVIGLIVTAASLSLAGCGTSTGTVKVAGSGISLSIVMTGDLSGFADAKGQLQNSTNGLGSGVTASFADGDTHEGNKICETDASSKSSGTYHVVIYSTAALPASTCDSFKSIG